MRSRRSSARTSTRSPSSAGRTSSRRSRTRSTPVRRQPTSSGTSSSRTSSGDGRHARRRRRRSRSSSTSRTASTTRRTRSRRASRRGRSPRMAVVSSAILNFVGAFFFFEVAATVATGIVNPDAITLEVVLAGLVGAITWNLDHLVPGPAVELEPRADRRGHGLRRRGDGRLRRRQLGGIKEKVLIPSLLAPTIGFLGGAADDDHHLAHSEARPRPGEPPVSPTSARLGGFVAFTTARTTPRRRWASSRSL